MSFPLNPEVGDIYRQWVWDGCNWRCGGNGGAGDGGAGGGGTFIGPTPPAAPALGQLWFNTSTNQLFVWSGTQWLTAAPRGVTVSALPPTSPAAGDFWFNTNNDFLYVFDGQSWVLSSAVGLTTVSPTPPSPATAGMLWHNTSNGLLYVYDGETAQWILAHPQSTLSGPNPPANPSPGDMWWSTTNDEMSIYDGTNWIPMTGTPRAGTIRFVQPTTPVGAEIGDMWFDTANDTLFVYDGTSWHSAEGVAGAQGPPGPPGNPALLPGYPWLPMSGGTLTGNLQIGSNSNNRSLTLFGNINMGSFTITCYEINVFHDAMITRDLYVGFGGYKPGGGPWSDSSDARIKDVTEEYRSGLAAIERLQPVRYRFKGNDSLAENQPSPHARAVTGYKQFVGLTADDVEKVLPECVERGPGFIDGKAVSDMRRLDTGPLLYCLINAVKELGARLDVLEGVPFATGPETQETPAPQAHPQRRKTPTKHPRKR